jgi:hypothetical protein
MYVGWTLMQNAPGLCTLTSVLPIATGRSTEGWTSTTNGIVWRAESP